MNRFSVSTILMIVTAGLHLNAPAAATAVEPQADRVIAMYFHRTERCPTCTKMGSYSKEAVMAGFAEEASKGIVEFHYVDYELPRNKALAQAYKVMGPALIVVKIENNRVAEYRDLEQIWTEVQTKPSFIQYVQNNVNMYLAR